MGPERFKCRVEEATSADWVLIHNGIIASAGMRVAILKHRMKTKVLAADTSADSDAFIDNQPKITGVNRCLGGGTVYVDALPHQELERFRESGGLSTILDEHQNAVNLFTEAGYDLNDAATTSGTGVCENALPVMVEQTETLTKSQVGSGDGTWLAIE